MSAEDRKWEYPVGFSDDGESEEVVEGRNGKKKKTEIGGILSWDVAESPANLLQDPLVAFGSDIMMVILKLLDARGIVLSLAVCRGWNGVASSDRIWTSKCEELMLGKSHVPRLSLERGLSKLAVYSMSFMDGQRTRIRKEDLCDHAWTYHFNKAAPEYWRKLDPFWEGTGPPMRRYFHLDGSHTADADDEVWGGHESCYCTVTSFAGEEGKIREHYVRINRWPGLTITRKADWSWDMSNALCSYSSVPDSAKEGGTGPLFGFS